MGVWVNFGSEVIKKEIKTSGEMVSSCYNYF